ncbi:MAG: YebC/PmpR family DNA-binding transcriptional regulator, partial [Rhodovibrionaceae bacterium]|nr:YebC/PmpR family DNA-binding transcriptional regulator [Rhodovibrionaceae bacterium]
RAIKRATGEGDGANYEEVRYEGYGPGGVAVIVEALTDNRNRTASEVRSAFSKHGGSLGETNSVSFQFERVGTIVYPAEVADVETMFEAAAEAGAQNVESDENAHEVSCAPDDFSDVRDTLTERFGDPREARLTWKPLNLVPIDEDQAATLLKLLDTLDDSDDVQSVSANYEITEDVLERLTA